MKADLGTTIIEFEEDDTLLLTCHAGGGCALICGNITIRFLPCHINTMVSAAGYMAGEADKLHPRHRTGSDKDTATEGG